MKLNITETVLRDANQSLIATRLPRENFESILDIMGEAGYYSVECWGGAIFDSCIRYLEEDPWERLKIMRKAMPDTKLQMLLRGQSLLGYKHYSDDVVRKFVYNSVEKGIDIIRIFDALNDIENIIVAVDETNRCGAHPSCAISYTVSPVHTIDSYISLAKQMEEIGAKSICIKDMSGILAPNAAYELISKLKRATSLPIILHSHCSTGYAYMTYLKAIEAGVDIIDTAISSFSGGTSQPATEIMVRVAEDMGREVSLDRRKLERINDHFAGIMEKGIKSGLLETKVLLTRPKTIDNQIPGGMYSNLLSQLKQQNLENKMDDVLNEVVNVRKDMGYPPLVTPISQMVGTQATVNVMLGERYKQVIEEVKAYFEGEYGTPPGEVDKKLMKRLVGKEDFPRTRLSKKLPRQYEIQKLKLLDKNYGRSDILTTILFPGMGDSFLAGRDTEKGERYGFLESAAGKINSDWIKVTEELPKLTKEKLRAIIAYRTGKSAENIKIRNVYEIGG
ncbi:pyruvate carboxylase subunit B [Anaerocolumna xylanovorans]|uniref:Oxaloacetate decarboxylase, alpha subunit n=1 Tax=Anaerocolumna xylanovorans DSM 12503 TaxID=1121345 RepID=A0A1M7Y2C0_9FIRM|nr:pyruvate carboxylase subunit B [Anaerocolumna xylanovorans]SHO46026.1 oxaloacetate decarboxylase, alpha subunit [Anaerocolumna xylanovorans DSM 12503]